MGKLTELSCLYFNIIFLFFFKCQFFMWNNYFSNFYVVSKNVKKHSNQGIVKVFLKRQVDPAKSIKYNGTVSNLLVFCRLDESKTLSLIYQPSLLQKVPIVWCRARISCALKETFIPGQSPSVMNPATADSHWKKALPVRYCHRENADESVNCVTWA